MYYARKDIRSISISLVRKFDIKFSLQCVACKTLTLIPYVSCIVAILGASYPKWPNNFRWATSGDHILFKRHKYKCTQFKEPNDLKWTSNKYLCWKGQTTADLQFSNSGMSQYSAVGYRIGRNFVGRK